jgi:hypothetical protein
MTIRFQATGERHKIDSSYYVGEHRLWWTKCGKKCVFMSDIGKMSATPTKKDCEVCYGG